MGPTARRRNPETADVSLRARLDSLRNVGPLLRLVWDTSPLLVSFSIAFRLLWVLSALAWLCVSNLILDDVVARIGHRGGPSSTIWKLVALEFGLAGAG